MKPFLYQVASLFYSEYGAEVSRLAFVFPNRRTGLFFQKYLSEVSEKPLADDPDDQRSVCTVERKAGCRSDQHAV